MLVNIMIRFGDSNIVKSTHGNRKKAKGVDGELEGSFDPSACLVSTSVSTLGLFHLYSCWAYATTSAGGLQKAERATRNDVLQQLVSSVFHNHDSAVWKLFITNDWAFPNGSVHQQPRNNKIKQATDKHSNTSNNTTKQKHTGLAYGHDHNHSPTSVLMCRLQRAVWTSVVLMLRWLGLMLLGSGLNYSQSILVLATAPLCVTSSGVALAYVVLSLFWLSWSICAHYT